MSLVVDRLCFRYGKRQVLRDISFSIEEGRLLTLLGANGAGKTTLLRCVLGLIKGYGGSVLIDGRPIHTMSPGILARHIAYIPQSHDPAFRYTALDMVLMGAAPHLRALASPGRREREAALSALAKLGIGDLADRGFDELSGGERQLVRVARALSQRAPLLIMDEPCASLDYGNQFRLLRVLRTLTAQGVSVLYSSHNPEHALSFADELLALKGGTLIARGAPGDMLTAGLMRALYGADVNLWGGK